ncbi:MAG: YdeI/OmpD-associated family protein [Actinomycetes bacterium]
MADELLDLVVRDQRAWRRWLDRNHPTSTGVWLVLARKGTTQPTSLTYEEALAEALCFGWIDGQLKSRDDDTFRRRFTPRRARSAWSRRNVGIVEQLRIDGRMHPAGEAEVLRAVVDGRWDAAYAGAATIEVPTDLAAAIARDPRAQAMFDILTSTNRYAIVLRTTQAKSAATRAKRIADFVSMLARGETVYPQRRALES